MFVHVFQRHHLGSGSSAFEQVPHLNIPATVPCAPQQVPHITIPTTVPWSANLPRQDKPEPPKVSVTAPQEDDCPAHQLGRDNFNVDINRIISPSSSLQNSSEVEVKSEELYHKKFDKMRKHATMETSQMENLTIHDVEQMESEDVDLHSDGLHSDAANVDRDNRVSSEKYKKSARDAHPQLLAQLKSGPQYKPNIHHAFQSAAGPHQFSLHQLQPTQGHPGGAMDALKNPSSISQNNVVLSVPQAPFATHNSPSTSPTSSSSMLNNHPCLHNILKSSESQLRGNEQFLSAECNGLQPNEKKVRTQGFLNNGHKLQSVRAEAQNFRNGHTYQPQLYPGSVSQARFDSQAATMQNPYMVYQQIMLKQHGVQRPQYNEHLVGMQQMVYGGNPQSSGR